MPPPNKLKTAINRLQRALEHVDELEGEQNELTESKRKANKLLQSATRLVVQVENDPQTELPLEDPDGD